MRRTGWLLTFLLIFLVASLPSQAAADPPWSRGGKGGKRYKHKKKEKWKEDAVHWNRGGPPPWAPAHGYRRKTHAYRREVRETTAYVAPFDLDLGRCNRTLLGSVLGGAAGAAVGSTIGKGTDRDLAIIGGTILGILVGGAIGQSMDELDQNCIGQALEHAPDNQTVQWENPDSGTPHSVTPKRVYQDQSGRYCREYTATSSIGGRTQQVYGTACRQPDGSWQRVN